MKQTLNGLWNLEFTEPDAGKKLQTQAPVPGNVEPLLVALGLLEDYMPADDRTATRKFDAVDDWCYTTVFDAEEAPVGWTQELVFEGIDTVAEIFLNGEKLGECKNMHIAYRFDVKGKLKATGNELKVVIHSAELWARQFPHNMYVAFRHSWYESQTFLRKARHQWGWDNAPRLLTSGIIRPVYVEMLPPKRFTDVYLHTMAVNETDVHFGAFWTYATDARQLSNHRIRLRVLDRKETVYTWENDVYFTQAQARCVIPRKAVKLWWPSGFGEPKLYTVKLEMLVDGAVEAEYVSEYGFRVIRLENSGDVLADGTGEFVFRVNGEKVFIRGTNWKPLDPLGSAADAKTREGRALQEIRNLHCNMVRIWGGGIYEDHPFYEYCDRNGIMVWQDFMIACEIPATEEWYCKVMEEEAVHIIRKLRNHPSLAVWCGDNENDECMTWVEFDSTAVPSNSTVTRKILKEAVLHYDPYRSYVESSPYASDENYKERKKGPMQHFQCENHFYPPVLENAGLLRQMKSFFIGETGPIILNSIAPNAKNFAREQARMERLWNEPVPTTGGNDNHQTDFYFTRWRQEGKKVCEAKFGRDFSLAEWKEYTLAVNYLCAELFKDIIEYCRVKRWSKTGVIWWSLMDMWPMAFNYSVIDSDYNRKLPYYWIRQSQQEIALVGVREEEDGELALYAVNDTLAPCKLEYTVSSVDESGNETPIASGRWTQQANSVSLIQRVAESGAPELWLIRWTVNGQTYTNHVAVKNPSAENLARWVKKIGDHNGFTPLEI